MPYIGFSNDSQLAGIVLATPDINGSKLIIDADGDTSITADTDDQIDIEIAGSDEIKITAAMIAPATADGSALGGTSNEWSDLYLADSAVIGLGADQDVTLTHVADTGVLLNSTRKIQFGDSATFIHQSSDGVMTVDGEATIDLNASTAVLVSNDLKLNSDAGILGFGADNDVTLTHVADTGVLLNSTMAIQFNDASQYINAPSNAILDINATDEIELNATLVDINANVEISGTATTTGVHTFTATPVFSSDITLSDDLNLTSDAAVISFGADSEVTLTHVHNDGLLLNTDMQLQFRDSAINIRSDADGDLDINADDEVEINSTLIDINGNVEISGTLAQVGVATFTARDIHSGGITIANDGEIGSVGDTNAIAISSAGVVALSATTEASATGTAALTLAGGIGVAKDMWIGDDIVLDSDSAVIKFGADQDVTLTHAADASLTLAGGTAAQLIMSTGSILPSTDTDTSNTGSVTLNFQTNQNFVLTFTGNVTLANPTTETAGQSGVIVCIQDGTGSRTLSLGTDYETAAGAGITLSTAANAVDVIPYFVKAAGSIQLGAVQLAFS